MIELNLARFKTMPFKHQLEGVKRLLTCPAFALFDEMGAGKTKQVVDAACVLHEAGALDTILVVSPSAVRGVWADPELGEIVKHAWRPGFILEYHNSKKQTFYAVPPPGPSQLAWVVTNYEFILREERLQELEIFLRPRKVMLVLDESSYIKNRRAQRTRVCLRLRRLARRVVILNGTPVANNPLDLWSQMNLLDPGILGYRNFFAFRARYAVMGGWHNKQIIKWQNLEEISALVKPHALRRLKKDCLDLPPKLYTTLEVPLAPATWRLYKQMREEMVAWLAGGEVSVAAQSIVKILRLAQLTSGFLGGVETEADPRPQPPREIGEEKTAFLVRWLLDRREANPGQRLIVWCRFRAEIERLARRLVGEGFRTLMIYGRQTTRQREEAVREFQEGSGEAVLIGQPQAGGFGLNLTAAHEVVYLSSDFNLLTRQQSEDRAHRPGQPHAVTYVDVVATGPDGQRTLDHLILKALRRKEEVARWTTDYWRQALKEE